MSISVWKADLSAFKVDAVVNAANESLAHHGGLAQALSKAGGPDIQAESDAYIAKNGQLQTGEAVVTSAGQLPCKNIIHAVGPCLRRNPTKHMVSMAKPVLTNSIWNVLKRAEEHNIRSVAIPAISSGIFNFPLPICADIIVSTVKKYVNQKNPTSPPFQIHLVNNDEKTVNEMERACKDILGKPLSDIKNKGNKKKPDKATTATVHPQVGLTSNVILKKRSSRNICIHSIYVFTYRYYR